MKKASNLRVVRLNRMNAYNAVDARLDRPVYERAAAWELMDLLRNPYNGLIRARGSLRLPAVPEPPARPPYVPVPRRLSTRARQRQGRVWG